MKMNRSIAMLAIGAGSVLAYQRYNGQVKAAVNKCVKNMKKKAKERKELDETM